MGADPYEPYVAVVRRNVAIDDPSAWDFKSDKAYRVVLEHVTREQARQYVGAVRAEFPRAWRHDRSRIRALFAENDRYGRPPLRRIHWRLPQCSPTNARYLYHALLALADMDARGLRAPHVVEIGGGYGGLCHFVHGLAPRFEVEIASYAILDLPDVAALQARYLEALGHAHVRTSYLEDRALSSVLEPGSFLLSNYALGELSPSLQQHYREAVIEPYVTDAFVIWNAPETYPRFYPGEPVPDMRSCFPGMALHEEAERPDFGEGTRFVYARTV